MEHELQGSWRGAATRPCPGATHDVFCLMRADGACAVRKVFRNGRAFRRERSALEFLASAQLSCCPRILASKALAGGGEILMSHVGGVVPSGKLLEHMDLWRQAGEALALLHDMPLPVADHLELRCAVERRILDAEKRAALWCDQSEGRILAWMKERMASLEPRMRVFCHGDWSPRNWLWRENQLFFVDLERSGPNAPEQDLVALHLECWQEDSRARSAFLEGYRTSGGPFNQAWLEILVLLHLVGSVNWGLSSQDTSWAGQSRAMLKREFNRVSASHL